MPLEPEFEHAVLALSPSPAAVGVRVPAGAMLHLGRDRRAVELTAEFAGRALLLGGESFTEDLVMWWNFVGRSHDDVVDARTTRKPSATATSATADSGP